MNHEAIVNIPKIYKTKAADGNSVLITHYLPKERVWLGVASKGLPKYWGLFGDGYDENGDRNVNLDLMSVPELLPMYPETKKLAPFDVCIDSSRYDMKVLLLKPMDNLHGGPGWRVLYFKPCGDFSKGNTLSKYLRILPNVKCNPFDEIISAAKAAYNVPASSEKSY